jgi:hypothetical protein
MLVIVVMGKRRFDRIMPTSIRTTSSAVVAADQNPSLLTKRSITHSRYSYYWSKYISYKAPSHTQEHTCVITFNVLFK